MNSSYAVKIVAFQNFIAKQDLNPNRIYSSLTLILRAIFQMALSSLSQIFFRTLQNMLSFIYGFPITFCFWGPMAGSLVLYMAKICESG